MVFTCQDVVRAIKLGCRLDSTLHQFDSCMSVHVHVMVVCFFAICLVRRINYPDLFSWHFALGFFKCLSSLFSHRIFWIERASCVHIDNIIRILKSTVSVASLVLHHQLTTHGLLSELPISVKDVTNKKCSSRCHFQHFFFYLQLAKLLKWNHSFDLFHRTFQEFSHGNNFEKQNSDRTSDSKRMFEFYRFLIWVGWKKTWSNGN